MVLLTLCLSSCEKDPPIGAPYAREIKVTDGTVSVVPYEHFAFGQRRVQSGGWATVDGLYLDSILKEGSEALKNIPTLTKTENVSVELGENGELRHFDVYDLEYNLIEPSRKTIEDEMRFPRENGILPFALLGRETMCHPQKNTKQKPMSIFSS
jgi:hypothetical protein